MSKKLLGLLLVAALLLGFSGQGNASYSNGDLMRVVYDYSNGTSTNQWYTDLGALSSLQNTSNNVVGTDIGTMTGENLSNLYVAYFVYRAPGGNYDIAGPGTLTRTGSSISSLAGGMTGIVNIFNTSAIGSTALDYSGNVNGYWNVMNGQGAYSGSFGNYLAIGATEASLAGLTTTGIQWNLTQFTGATAVLSPGTLYTNSNSSNFVIDTVMNNGLAVTEINPSAVPIPGAVWLLGSGLLGLIGIRRRS